MKKFLSVFAVVMILVIASAVLVACSGSSAVTISGYTVKETTYTVGDTLGTPSITATLSDGTTKTVSNNVVLKQSDLDALKAGESPKMDEDNKFLVAGEYVIHVYHLEEKEGYEVGTWTITVKATK